MLNTLEGTLNPDGTIHFRERLRLNKSRRVLVTLLEEEDALPEDAERMKRLQALLAAPEFRDRPYGSPEELETVIDHNRAAWDE